MNLVRPVAKDLNLEFGLVLNLQMRKFVYSALRIARKNILK